MTLATRTMKLYFPAAILLHIWLPNVCDSGQTDKSASTLDYTKINLTAVPQQIPESTSSLNLSTNAISVVGPNAFENCSNMLSLDLSHNRIVDLHRDSLMHMPRLELLDISHNKLGIAKGELPAGLFVNQGALRILKLHGQLKDRTNRDYPDDALSHLKDLEYLSIRGRSRKLGAGFGKLRNLKFLVFSDRNCYINFMPSDMFSIIEDIKLTHLSLRFCHLIHIANGSFTPLRYLQVLNMACNQNLGLPAASQAVSALGNTSLHTLILDITHRSSGRSTITPIMDAKAVSPLSKIPLKRLSLSHNDFIEIDVYFLNNLPPGLEEIVLDGLSPLSQIHSVSNIHPLKSLVSLSLRHTFDYTIKRHEWATPGTCYNRSLATHMCTAEDIDFDMGTYFPMPLVPLKEIQNVSHIALQPSPTDKHRKTDNLHRGGHILHKMFPNLAYWYFDNSKWFGVPDSGININFTCPVPLQLFSAPGTRWSTIPAGLMCHQLQYINLNHTGLTRIYKTALHKLPALRYLWLGHNRLGKCLSDDTAGEIFKMSFNLRRLDLSHNGIDHLPFLIFQGLHAIQWLSLSNNRLVRFDTFLGQIATVSYLDLSYNRVLSLPQNVTSLLGEYSNRSLVTLNLLGDYYICSCDASSIYFRTWLYSSPITNILMPGPDDYSCVYRINSPTKSPKRVSIMVEIHEDECAHHTTRSWPLIVGIACTLFVILSIAFALVGKYKWHIQYYYLKNKHRFVDGRMAVNQNEYDIYCVNDLKSDADRYWTNHILLPKVEEEWQLRMCLEERDFEPGAYIGDNIANAITHSHKVVLIVSQSFVRSEWCEFASQMAVVKGMDYVLCVLLDDVVDRLDVMPKCLRCLLLGKRYIVWPRHNGNKRRKFWNLLERFIKEQRVHPNGERNVPI